MNFLKAHWKLLLLGVGVYMLWNYVKASGNQSASAKQKTLLDSQFGPDGLNAPDNQPPVNNGN
jgi:hypothetical protein